MNRRRTAVTLAVIGAAALTLTACTAPAGEIQEGEDTGELTLWLQDGESPESIVINELVDQFEAENEGVTIKLRGIAQADYNQTILTTPNDELGDVLLVDGPNIAAYAYNGKIAPLGEWLSDDTIDNQSDPVVQQNTYADGLYAISLINSGMGLWGNKALLDAAGITLPTSPEDAWTAEEFSEVLATLAAQDPDGKPFGIAENYGLTSEYGIYGFAPVIWSAGSPIIKDGKAEGALDSDAAVDAMTTFASWRQYVDPDTDGQAFHSGRVALQWMGHWNYVAYSEALGENLQVGPLPDFGDGAKTGTGSIAWAMGSGTKNAKLAAKFLDFMASDASVTAYADASGAPPATKTVAATSERYGPGGPLEMLGQQLLDSCPTENDLAPDCVGVVRPVTPGYPTVTLEFGKALAAIWAGDDVKESLGSAARAIDRDAEDNNNYED
ncbi:MAG TPA: extracellular solute-binding protein [Microbacterium sp.]|uniref:ABC transporter substrate-binding protein n=1 Tax=Microbacterium sp. TaxID=51671 RepID=UPI002C4EE1F2|nr:extracellular solute-binding protein [Microbacterium sp.]HWI31995.1 extracellular solute-binding protein [Microbacterium sp.]